MLIKSKNKNLNGKNIPQLQQSGYFKKGRMEEGKVSVICMFCFTGGGGGEGKEPKGTSPSRKGLRSVEPGLQE